MVNVTQQKSNVHGAEYVRVLVPIIIVVILIFAGKSLLTGFKNIFTSPFKDLGLADTDEQKAAVAKTASAVKKLDGDTNGPFSTSYYVTQQKKYTNGVHLITSAAAKKIVAKIHDAIGNVYDSPDVILGQFKALSYKTQVSFLSKVFLDTYDRDLFEFLQEKLDTTDQKIILGKIIDYVNKLPVGKV